MLLFLSEQFFFVFFLYTQIILSISDLSSQNTVSFFVHFSLSHSPAFPLIRPLFFFCLVCYNNLGDESCAEK